MKRIISLLLALALLLSALTLFACNTVDVDGDVKNDGVDKTENKKAPEGLLVYKNNAIPGGMFLFLLSQSKSTYLYSTTGEFKDDKDLWSEESDDGKTVGEILFDETLDSALSILYYADVAEQNGITLTEEEENEITETLDTLVQSYGSQTQFNNEMIRFGVGYNILRDFYRLEALAQKGADSVLNEGGSDPISDDELLDYYKNNFITLRHIYFNTVYDDPDTGEPLTQEQKDAKSARADEILDLVNNKGKKLSDFKDESEDGIINDNGDGITLPLGDLLNVYASATSDNNIFYSYYFLFYNVRGFAEAALMHESGVVTRVDNEGVGIFLVERTPLILNMFDQYKDAIRQFVFRPQRMSDTVAKLKSENAFTINEAALATYNIASAPVMKAANL